MPAGKATQDTRIGRARATRMVEAVRSILEQGNGWLKVIVLGGAVLWAGHEAGLERENRLTRMEMQIREVTQDVRELHEYMLPQRPRSHVSQREAE